MYKVVKNEEEQYSIWPLEKPTPKGWVETGEIGEKDYCLNYIGRIWLDLRPKSIRGNKEEENV